MTAGRVITLLLFSCALAILLGLGTWQLVRGLEKAKINDQVATGRQTEKRLLAQPDNWADLDYSLAIFAGNWREEKSFLLANRLLQGRPGYEVLTPWEFPDGSWILVNRGWRSDTETKNFGITKVQSDQPPSGQLYRPSKGFTLGQTWSGEIDWPLEVLYYDMPALSRALEHSLAPAVLVLNQQHPDSFVTIWRPTTITPERHYAYAAQWWGLALTLIVFGLIWRRKLPPPNSDYR